MVRTRKFLYSVLVAAFVKNGICNNKREYAVICHLAGWSEEYKIIAFWRRELVYRPNDVTCDRPEQTCCRFFHSISFWHAPRQ